MRGGPDQSAVISASVVGYAMPAARPPISRAAKSTVSVGAQAARMHAGIDEPDAEDEHELAAVAVAERTEVEHRGGKAQRVADGDEVERGLRGVERLPDVGQRDVGDRQVQVGDRRHQDQRDEDDPGPFR